MKRHRKFLKFKSSLKILTFIINKAPQYNQPNFTILRIIFCLHSRFRLIFHHYNTQLVTTICLLTSMILFSIRKMIAWMENKSEKILIIPTCCDYALWYSQRLFIALFTLISSAVSFSHSLSLSPKNSKSKWRDNNFIRFHTLSINVFIIHNI